jgi:hypothetical protein
LSTQLEQIGEKLRGKQKFSVFYSIILPIIVSAATLIFSSLFQYVSWINSVNTKSASEVAANASATYAQAVQVISKRYYATFLFLPSVRNMANRKEEVDGHLYKLDSELNQKRFNGYYEQLQSWNENYDQILTAIDRNLDRPIFADVDRGPLVVTQNRFVESKSDCSKSLLEIVEGAGYFKNSLKAQFATINYCFVTALIGFNEQKDAAILGKRASIDPEVEKKNVATTIRPKRYHRRFSLPRSAET